MKSFKYTIQDSRGIHAAPAGMLAKEAIKYNSKILLIKDQKTIEVTELLEVMGLGIKRGQDIVIEILGDDEEIAYRELKAFFEENL